MVNADCVLEKKSLDDLVEVEAKELAGVSDLDELKLPLPNVSRKALEERERRAVRLAEESFSHVNQKVSNIRLHVSWLYCTGVPVDTIHPPSCPNKTVTKC